MLISCSSMAEVRGDRSFWTTLPYRLTQEERTSSRDWERPEGSSMLPPPRGCLGLCSPTWRHHCLPSMHSEGSPSHRRYRGREERRPPGKADLGLASPSLAPGSRDPPTLPSQGSSSPKRCLSANGKMLPSGRTKMCPIVSEPMAMKQISREI